MFCNSAYSSHNDCSSPTCCQIHAIKNLNMSCYPSKTPQNDKFAIHFSCFKPKFFLRLSRSYICQRKGSCFLLVPLPFSAFHIFHHFLIYICFDPLLCLECLLYSLHSSISKDLMKADFCKSTRKPNFDYISAVTVTSQWDSCVLLFVNEIWRGRQCCSLKKTKNAWRLTVLTLSQYKEDLNIYTEKSVF